MRSSEWLQNVKSVVIKLGTGILTDSDNKIDPAQIEAVASQASALRQMGLDVIIVSSGAVGAGMGTLGFQKRPTGLGDLQACAALGQVHLLHAYSGAFKKHDIAVAQVLLTHEDLKHKERHLNARNTLESLLNNGVIPIVNENDAVSFTELQFGDNDKLSALVACLVPVDLLIILTSAEGLIRRFGKPDAERISLVKKIDDEIKELAGGTTAVTAKGGMKTKIEAAEIVTRSGLPMLIANGRDTQILAGIMDGEDIGTLFVPESRKLKSHKRWIAFYHKPSASLLVDHGAEKALRKNGKSLLPPGITKVTGSFKKGDVVRICDQEGREFARGVATCSSSQVLRKDEKLEVVVHRDHLVLL